VQLFREFDGFDWDDANREKNWARHRVTWWECEEVFFNQPLYVLPDTKHSETEPRFYALGVTSLHRPLFLAFTRRKNKIRVISAREMSKKERKLYSEKAQEDSQA
jgi:uncharacterized DUF497 family protein